MTAAPARRFGTVAVAIVIAAIVLSAALLSYSRLEVTVTSTTTTTITTTSPSCGQTVYTPQTNLTLANVPVLLMEPGATGYICVTYQSAWKGNASSYNSQFFPNGTYQFGLAISDQHCAAGTSNGCPTGVSHSFTIVPSPSTITPTPTTDYVSVSYTVTAFANATGFYDRSAPYDVCNGMPMAVGHSVSQVNSSDFGPIVYLPCAFPLFTPIGVSVGGMGVVYIPFSS